MKKMLLFAIALGLLSACGESKSALSISRDSLDVAYEKLGFHGFCDARKEDDFLHMTATAIAELRFPDNEDERIKAGLELYNEYFSKWEDRHRLDRDVYYKDKKKETLEMGNICEKIIGYQIERFRESMLEYIRDKKYPQYSDVIFAIQYGYFLNSKKSNKNAQSSSTPYATDESAIKCLSSWDGSIYDFEVAVKKMINDPESFEHIETGANVKDGEATVRMKFRAKNGFGGSITTYAYAILNTSDCSVVNVRIEE